MRGTGSYGAGLKRVRRPFVTVVMTTAVMLPAVAPAAHAAAPDARHLLQSVTLVHAGAPSPASHAVAPVTVKKVAAAPVRLVFGHKVG